MMVSKSFYAILNYLLTQKELLPRTQSRVPRIERVTSIQEGLAHLGQMGRYQR